MTIRRGILGLILVLCGGLVLRAQAPGDAAAGDPTANAEQQKVKTLLQQMIQALGGDAWLNAPGYELVGRTSGFYQGRPTGAIADFFDYRQPPDKERVELGKRNESALLVRSFCTVSITVPLEVDVETEMST